MPPFPLSSFQRAQVTLELRYDEAFILWDHTGKLWETIRKQFRTLKHTQVTPSQTAFTGDDRFGLLVALDRAIITDHRPSGGASSTVEVMSKFAQAVIEHLHVPVLNRVGTRLIYRLRCKDGDEARAKLSEAMPMNFGGATFFNIKPDRFAPHLKLDVNDGELAYTVQLHINERKYDFEPPPDMSDVKIEALHETISELTFDVDLFTLKQIPTESFDVKVWLTGCNKTIGADADRFLDAVKGMHE